MWRLDLSTALGYRAVIDSIAFQKPAWHSSRVKRCLRGSCPLRNCPGLVVMRSLRGLSLRLAVRAVAHFLGAEPAVITAPHLAVELADGGVVGGLCGFRNRDRLRVTGRLGADHLQALDDQLEICGAAVAFDRDRKAAQNGVDREVAGRYGLLFGYRRDVQLSVHR